MMNTNKSEMTAQKSIPPVEDVRTWQWQLVRGVLRILVVVGLFAAAAGSYYDYTRQTLWTIPLYWIAYALIALITFWRRAPYSIQAGSLLAALYGLAILDFVSDGRGGSGRLFLLVLLFAAGLLLGRRGGIFAITLAFLTMLGLGWAFSTGHITIKADVNSTDPSGWVSNTLVLLLAGSFVLVSHNHVIPRLMKALTQSRQLAQELEEERGHLTEQVTERTKDLQRRSAQLETAAQIARDATAIQDMEQLLRETVGLISNRFGYEHAGIFLLDETGEYAVLRAASSEGGQRMLARGHRLKVGETGIVGDVTARGQPHIALDVGADAVFFNNPDLPETRSEMALALRTRGSIIGALDVQSHQPNAFSSEDVAVLQTLADQIAIAINNARLVQRVQESLQVERRAYGDLSFKAWQEMLRAQPDLAQRYDPHGALPTDGQWREDMKRAAQKGETIQGVEGISPTLTVPLKVRERVVGVLDAHKPEGTGEWTTEEITLLETLTDQLGVALESARLYQDIQRRAAREQLIGAITSRMRETLDMETVLQTAVREMGDLLNLAEVQVRMRTGPTLEAEDNAQPRLYQPA